MIENAAQLGAIRNGQMLLGGPHNVLQYPEKQYFHAHFQLPVYQTLTSGNRLRRFIIAPMAPHQTRVRVRYAETDQMGVVYYANYLVWMEVARVEYCKALGFRYKDMELDDGVLLAVVEANCRYLYPARFDEEVTVETHLAEANPRIVSFHYEMRLAENERKLATGSTRHIFCNREMKPVRLPEKYRAMFGIE